MPISDVEKILEVINTYINFGEKLRFIKDLCEKAIEESGNCGQK